MKPRINKALLLAVAVLALFAVAFASTFFTPRKPGLVHDQHINCTPEKHVCVMKSIFNLDENQTAFKSVSKQYLDNTSDESRKLDGFFVQDFRTIYTLINKKKREIMPKSVAHAR